jgi:hypothetical protein
MRRFQPALLGGLFIGVLSSLPIIGSANACCCLWVVTGGFLTVYLQRQAAPSVKDTAEAVLGGLIAGVVGAIIAVLAQALLSSAGGDAMVAEMESAFDQIGQVPQDVRDRLISLVSSGAFVLVIAALLLPLYAVFGMLGALLAVALLPKPKGPTNDPPAPLQT